MPPQYRATYWNAETGRFHDIETHQFVSYAEAIPGLRVWEPPGVPGGGVLRDALGRFVPKRFLGGDVVSQWPAGKADYAAVTREVPVNVREMPVRGQDVLQGTVSFNVAGKAYDDVFVTMPKGYTYSEPVWEERVAHSLTGEVRYTTGEEIEWEDVEIESVSWNVTTFYEPGQYLGGDYAYWEGM